jgi:hypothetical protein
MSDSSYGTLEVVGHEASRLDCLVNPPNLR